VDILIAHSQDEQLAAALRQAGYSLIAKTEIFRRYRSDNIYLMDLDAILVDQRTFDQLMASSIGYSIDGMQVHIPSLIHLIALKIHAVSNNPDRAAKDLLDVSELLRLNPEAVTKDEIAQVLDKYGNSDIEKKLKAIM
jgi:hypothetical protein